MILSLVLLAAFQTPPSAPTAPPHAQAGRLAASPIATLQVTPGTKVTMSAYDTLRLRAVALDAAGKPVEGVTYKFMPAGGRFEGKVDTTGLVQSGSTGNLGVSVIATVPGTKPVVERGRHPDGARSRPRRSSWHRPWAAWSWASACA